MWISQIRLDSIRGFASQYFLGLSQKINLFVGQNNAGKSTILNTILLLQKQNSLTFEDITLGKQQGRIEIWLNDIANYAKKYKLLTHSITR
jgi:predicted ATP-dependent endonuclease of OLD family